jgi:hypothetical protein
MDKADAPTQSMFWRFFDNSELAVMGSSRLVNSWLMLSLFNRAFAIYEDSTNFFMEVYIPGDSPTTFIANRGSITKLWLPFTEAGTYTLVPDQDIAIVKPTMRVGITNMKYDIGVILQALNGTKPPAIRFRANSHFSLNLGLAGDQGGPVTLDGLKIHRRDSDEYLPAPFEKVLFEAGTYVDTIDVYVVSVRYPVTISNSIINEIGVDDRRGASYNPDPCNPCSEAIVDHSTIGWADSAATGSGPKRRVRLTIKDTDIWNQTIFAHEYGSIYISGASVIRGGAFVESTGSLNCAGECSWIDIAKTATITPNPACPGDRTTPEGVPLCQPLRNAGSLPTYTVCNGGVIHNGADSGAQTVTCTTPMAVHSETSTNVRGDITSCSLPFRCK